MFKKTDVNILISIAFLMLTTPFTSAYAGNILIIDNDLKKLSAGQYIYYMEDKDDKITIEDISSGRYNERWIASHEEKPIFGYKATPYWINITLKNNDKKEISFYLEQAYLGVHKIILYDRVDKGYRKLKAGMTVPFNEFPVKTNSFVFPLKLKPGEKKTYILHCLSAVTHDLQINIWSVKEFWKEKKIEYTILFMFYAIMIVMTLYNLILWFFIRLRVYIYYIIFLITETLMLMALNGTANQFLWPSMPRLNIYGIPFTVAGMLTALILFCIELVNFRAIKNESAFLKYAYRIFISLIPLNVVIFILFFLIPHNIAYPILGAVNVLEFNVIIITAIYTAVFKKSRAALIGINAGFYGLIGAIIYTLKNIGVLPPNLFTNWSVYIGVVLMVLLFSIGLADSINQMRKDLQDSRNRLSELNINLETQVQERTSELLQANNLLIYNSIKIADTNEKLKEMDKLKSNFFANVSHEIRTPLTLILSPVESVLQGEYGKSIDKDFLINIKRNSMRLLRLINNILDFARLEAGRMKLKIREVDIVKVIKNYTTSIIPSAESKGISVNFISLNNSVKLYIDVEKTDKIAMNILSNALKFSDRGGKIDIRVKDDDNNCYIEFEDTGEGIPEDKLDSIFDRFTQVDSSSTRMHEGTGIGLSLVKELVELTGGSIRVESRHVDKYPESHGTMFTITFPKGKEHLKRRKDAAFIKENELQNNITDYESWDYSALEPVFDSKKTSPREDLFNKKNLPRVLVVEDNPDMARFLQFLLQNRYDIQKANNGIEGLEKAELLKPDLIITDVMMPIMNGYEMTRKIKDNPELRGIPVLMLTAKAEISEKIEGLEHGADDYLTKPFNSRELLARVKSLLRIKELQDQLISININLEKRVENAVSDILQREHEALEIIGSAAEFRDLETAEHFIRVSEYSRILAKALGKDEEIQELLYYAAPLHDVGKIGIPDSILLKDGSLSTAEFEIMKNHCRIGYEILSGKKSKYIQAGAIISLTHHERYDGTGYPKSLKGSDIPLYGRIVAVVDVFDALTTRRPYKEPMPFDDSVNIILNERGSHFDPVIIDAFIKSITEIKNIYLSNVRDSL